MAKSLINVEKADNRYFTPVINENHCKVYKWLVDCGYTSKYIAICLDLDITMLNRKFRQPNTFTLHQVQVVMLLLKGYKGEWDILSSLLCHGLPVNPSALSSVYSLPLPSVDGSIQVYRSDFEPKVKKG